MKKKSQKKLKAKSGWKSGKEIFPFSGHALDLPVKVRITTLLDDDVLQALKNGAIESGIKYQTLLNQILKEKLLKKKDELTEIREDVRQMKEQLEALHIEMHLQNQAHVRILKRYLHPNQDSQTSTETTVGEKGTTFDQGQGSTFVDVTILEHKH